MRLQMGAEGLETLAAPAGYQDALLREGAMRLLVTCLDTLEGDEQVGAAASSSCSVSSSTSSARVGQSLQGSIS